MLWLLLHIDLGIFVSSNTTNVLLNVVVRNQKLDGQGLGGVVTVGDTRRAGTKIGSAIGRPEILHEFEVQARVGGTGQVNVPDGLDRAAAVGLHTEVQGVHQSVLAGDTRVVLERLHVAVERLVGLLELGRTVGDEFHGGNHRPGTLTDVVPGATHGKVLVGSKLSRPLGDNVHPGCRVLELVRPERKGRRHGRRHGQTLDSLDDLVERG